MMGAAYMQQPPPAYSATDENAYPETSGGPRANAPDLSLVDDMYNRAADEDAAVNHDLNHNPSGDELAISGNATAESAYDVVVGIPSSEYATVAERPQPPSGLAGYALRISATAATTVSHPDDTVVSETVSRGGGAAATPERDIATAWMQALPDPRRQLDGPGSMYVADQTWGDDAVDEHLVHDGQHAYAKIVDDADRPLHHDAVPVEVGDQTALQANSPGTGTVPLTHATPDDGGDAPLGPAVDRHAGIPAVESPYAGFGDTIATDRACDIAEGPHSQDYATVSESMYAEILDDDGGGQLNVGRDQPARDTEGADRRAQEPDADSNSGYIGFCNAEGVYAQGVYATIGPAYEEAITVNPDYATVPDNLAPTSARAETTGAGFSVDPELSTYAERDGAHIVRRSGAVDPATGQSTAIAETRI